MFDAFLHNLKRILLVIALSSLLSVLIVDLYLHDSLEVYAIQSWDDNQTSHLQHISHLVDQQLNDALQDLKFISEQPEFQELPYIGEIDLSLNGLPEEIDGDKRRLLESFLLHYKRFSVLFILTSTGDHYISHPFSVQRSLKKYNLSDRPYIQRARQSKTSVISNRFVGADGVPAVAMAIPLLTKEGEIFGYLGGVFHLRDIPNLLLQGMQADSTYFLVDRAGQLIANTRERSSDKSRPSFDKHPLIESFLLKSKNIPVEQKTKKHKPHFSDYFCNIHDTECRGAYVILDSGWGLFAEKSETAIWQAVYPQVRDAIVIVTLILVALGCLALMIVNFIAKRLKKAQKELQKSYDGMEEHVAKRTAQLATQERHTRLLLESVAEAIYGIDVNGQCTFCNPACVAILGYESEQALLGKNMHQLIHYSHRDGTAYPAEECMIYNVYLTGQQAHLEDEVLWKADGSKVEVDLRAHPIVEEGNIIGAVVTFIDIKERKIAAQKLKDSEHRFRKLFENTEISIWDEDLSEVLKKLDELRLDGVTDLRRYLKENRQGTLELVAMIKVTHVNDATLGLFGARDEREMLSQIETTFGPNALEVFIDELCAIWDKKKVFRAEVDFQSLDGRKLKTVLSFHIPETREGFESIPVSILDITERKRAEEERERLSHAIEQADETFVVTDSKGTIQYVNSAFEKVTGYLSTEAIGQNPRILKSGHQNDEFYREMWDTLTRGETWRGRFINKKKDGTLYTEEATISPVLDSSGVAINYVAVKRDITKEIELEDQLRQFHKMEAVGQLAGGVAHDFNNLLAIISGNIDIIQYKQASGNPSKENIGHIKEATSRAKELVQQILTFSRQEKHQLVSINFTLAVNDSLKLLRSTLPATIEIMNTLNQSGAVFIKADTIQLQQVVINLCANAVSAMDEKGLLRITLKKIELASEDLPAGTGRPRGKYAKLSVIDTGSGMTKETMDKIFDPFFTTKAVGVGTGMGLSVVHGIVEQHGGFVTVDSILGQGTSFNIFFPIAKQDAAKLKTVKTESLPTGTERILFVDDEECIAETCGELLEYQGYKVTSVTSSTKALELFIANPEAFDLVFTDQTMPEISGADLATELLKIRPNIPIILCSGYSAKVSEVDAKRIGIRKFCHKPIDMKQLAIVARAVLDESDRHYEEN